MDETKKPNHQLDDDFEGFPDHCEEFDDPNYWSRQHRKHTGKLSEASISCQDTQSPELYLKLRRENPGEMIQISRPDNPKSTIASLVQLRDQGIHADTVAGVLDGSLDAINNLSLYLLEKLIDREKLQAQGENQLQSRNLVIKDSLVSYLIGLMFEGMDRSNNMEMSRDLMVLIKYHLGFDKSQYIKKVAISLTKFDAINTAIELEENNQKASIRKVAEILGVDPSTISRMFPNNSFNENVKMQQQINKLIEYYFNLAWQQRQNKLNNK